MKKLRNIFASYILCLLQITTKLLRITTTLLITNYDEVFITNYDSFCIITNCDNIITNYDRYYKLRQNIYFISYEIIKTVIFGIQTKQLFGPEEGVRAQLPGTSAYKRLNLM